MCLEYKEFFSKYQWHSIRIWDQNVTFNKKVNEKSGTLIVGNEKSLSREIAVVHGVRVETFSNFDASGVRKVKAIETTF